MKKYENNLIKVELDVKEWDLLERYVPLLINDVKEKILSNKFINVGLCSHCIYIRKASLIIILNTIANSYFGEQKYTSRYWFDLPNNIDHSKKEWYKPRLEFLDFVTRLYKSKSLK